MSITIQLSELHLFYTRKMWELENKERKSLVDSLSGDQLGTLGDCLVDAEIKQRYSELKKHVKEETVQAILRLNAKFANSHSLSPQQHGSGSSQQQPSHSPPTQSPRTTHGGKSPKKKSPQKSSRTVLDSKTTDILNKWFEEHNDKPYPTKKEKEELAKCCKITIKQVSTWFNNKRYRSNCTLTKKGKGKGKGLK